MRNERKQAVEQTEESVELRGDNEQKMRELAEEGHNAATFRDRDHTALYAGQRTVFSGFPALLLAVLGRAVRRHDPSRQAMDHEGIDLTRHAVNGAEYTRSYATSPGHSFVINSMLFSLHGSLLSRLYVDIFLDVLKHFVSRVFLLFQKNPLIF